MRVLCKNTLSVNGGKDNDFIPLIISGQYYEVTDHKVHYSILIEGRDQPFILSKAHYKIMFCTPKEERIYKLKDLIKNL
jgi:hypothetical protein